MADLIADLWDASYQGVPFYIEKNDYEGGRRLVTHVFPLIDDPFIEDMGRRPGKFSIDAYVVGDDYASAAEALRIVCEDIPGPGTLVLPTTGPVTARCETIKPNREKDKIGFIAVRLEFKRDGIATPFVSVGYLAQLAFDANDALGAALGGLVAQFAVVSQPSWIVAGVASAAQDTVATLEDLRATSALDPAKSYATSETLANLYNAIPALVSPVGGIDATLAPQIVAAARSIAAAMPPASAAQVFGAAVDAVTQPAPVVATGNRATAATNAALAARMARLAMLSAYLDAVLRATYASRPAGVTARALLVERFDLELANCNGALNVDLYVALQNLRNAGVAYLSQLITTLAPIVTVSTPISLPSLVLAWALYQDPLRAPELVARNGVRHPSYMPAIIEALAPSASS